MPKVRMPRQRRKCYFKGQEHYMVIEEWVATVPAVVVRDEDVLIEYTRYFRRAGCGVVESAEKAQAAIQDTYNLGFKAGLTAHTHYWATKYSEMFPDLVSEGKKGEISLLGFKPEAVQFGFVPGQRPGRKGLPFMNNLLQEMANDERG